MSEKPVDPKIPQHIVEDLDLVLDPAGINLQMCPDCGHSLENNKHGFDQNDGCMDGDKLIHSGRCTYCRFCNLRIFVGAKEV
jgi:hypothetical protein